MSLWRHTGSEVEAQGAETPARRRRGFNSPKQVAVSGESCSGRGTRKLLTVTRVVVNLVLTEVWVLARCFHVEVARLGDLDCQCFTFEENAAQVKVDNRLFRGFELE